MAILKFKDAEKVRDAITVSQQKEIANLYNDWSKDLEQRANYYAHKTTSSSSVSERQAKELYRQMKETSKQVSNEVNGIIKHNMYIVSDAVVQNNAKWMSSLGFDQKSVQAAFTHVPDSVVRNIVTGNVYDSGWSLSQRIWGNNEQMMKEAYQIVGKGLAENKSIYNIAKDLGAYVDPNARKPWNPPLLTKVTKTGEMEYARIFRKQVDYNAQRLARTLVQHSYQQSFVATTQKNPFVESYIWIANGSRVCPLCEERDGKEFRKDELPLDHPNGMCTMDLKVPDDLTDRLADWINSPDGTYPEIDEFAGNFGYTPSKVPIFGSKEFDKLIAKGIK